MEATEYLLGDKETFEEANATYACQQSVALKLLKVLEESAGLVVAYHARPKAGGAQLTSHDCVFTVRGKSPTQAICLEEPKNRDSGCATPARGLQPHTLQYPQKSPMPQNASRSWRATPLNSILPNPGDGLPQLSCGRRSGRHQAPRGGIGRAMLERTIPAAAKGALAGPLHRRGGGSSSRPLPPAGGSCLGKGKQVEPQTFETTNQELGKGNHRERGKPSVKATQSLTTQETKKI